MDHDTLKHGVLIIGGGPSGLSSALHLARDFPHLTPRILILEKARYPRLKLCAGGLTLDAEVILERLGLDVNEIPHVDAENIHFDFKARGRDEFSFSGFRRRVLRSALGQTLIARWVIAYIVYPLNWKWFQILLWRALKPVLLLVAWLFVLNWGRRLG
jgi:flavin-dependent dehydrogenase